MAQIKGCFAIYDDDDDDDDDETLGCTFKCQHQNTVETTDTQYSIYFENAAKLKYFETTVTYQKYIFTKR
jgi:hypothetical protein